MAELFPRGIAQGEAFYDRFNEREKLKRNIKHTVHTVLIAPRRYGKTSLMTQVLFENNIPHAWIDFMTITNMSDVQEKLLHKISELIVKIAPTTKKLNLLLTKYFSALKPEIILKLPGVVVKLTPSKSFKTGIIESLINLDKLAQEVKVRLVIVFDEFQEVLRIDGDSTLQGSIRHAVERSKMITYLFSGSKHASLLRMFNGKEAPLYALCETMDLNKIPDGDYILYVNNAAKKKWGKPLAEEVINQILSYSDRYPKYINALCGAIWSFDDFPTLERVNQLWLSYVISKKTDITDDLSDLTLNHRRLLQWLCFNTTSELYSKETLSQLKMSQSSVQKAIEILLEKSFVIEDNRIYHVLDPLIKSYFTIY